MMLCGKGNSLYIKKNGSSWYQFVSFLECYTLDSPVIPPELLLCLDGMICWVQTLNLSFAGPGCLGSIPKP